MATGNVYSPNEIGTVATVEFMAIIDGDKSEELLSLRYMTPVVSAEVVYALIVTSTAQGLKTPDGGTKFVSGIAVGLVEADTLLKITFAASRKSNFMDLKLPSPQTKLCTKTSVDRLDDVLANPTNLLAPYVTPSTVGMSGAVKDRDSNPAGGNTLEGSAITYTAYTVDVANDPTSRPLAPDAVPVMVIVDVTEILIWFASSLRFPGVITVVGSVPPPGEYAIHPCM